MKAIMRGGPNDRKRMMVQDGITRLQVAKPKSSPYMSPDHPLFDAMTTAQYGFYSRTMEPRKKDGVYYFVWMGWDE